MKPYYRDIYLLEIKIINKENTSSIKKTKQNIILWEKDVPPLQVGELEKPV